MAVSPDVDVTPLETVPAAQPGRIRMIVVLGLLVALGPLTIDMYLPALPKIADDLSVSSSVAQLTLTGTLAGLALGQLIIGPLSDSLGRRKPLIGGIVLHMLASLMCLFAPNIAVLGIARGLQGIGAAAGMVVAIAVVGDLYKDNAAATVMSRLMLVLGVAPVLAPSLGAAVLLHASWHWVFAALVIAAGALLVMAVLALPETLPVGHRRPLKVAGIARTYAELLRDTRLGATETTLVASAQRAADSLLEIINEILDFSRVESGRLELERVEFQLEAQLNDVASGIIGLLDPVNHLTGGRVRHRRGGT